MNNVPTVRMNDVPLACEELAKSISELEEALSQFQNNLSKITRQEPSTGIGERPSKQSECELSGTIRDQVNRLQVMSERIRSHTSALEL